MKIARSHSQAPKEDVISVSGQVYGKFLAYVKHALNYYRKMITETPAIGKMFNHFSCLLSVYLTMITGARISEAVAMAITPEKLI